MGKWSITDTACKVSLFEVVLVRMRENAPSNSEYRHILRSVI